MKSIYQDENWLCLQEIKEKGKAIEYKYEDEHGCIIYPFIMREAGIIDDIRYYDLVTARGERGIEIDVKNSVEKSNLINNFDKNFNEYCKKNNIIAEFVRFSPWEDYSMDFKELYNIKYYGNLYCVNLCNDFLYTEFNSNKRRDINFAKKSGIKIKMDLNGNTINDFIELYKYTESKYNVSEYYNLTEEFLQNYFTKLNDKVFLINAYYEEKLISSCMILLGKDIAHYHYSANNPDYKKLQANTYLLYESMLYAKNKGKLLFDLGGATPGSSLEKYKVRFIEKNKENCIFKYNIGTKIRNKEIYDKLVKKVGGPRENYFPEYRR